MCVCTGDESVIMCGIAQEDVSSNSKAHTRPWHVNIITVQTLFNTRVEWMDGWMDGWMGGWLGMLIDGRIDE